MKTYKLDSSKRFYTNFYFYFTILCSITSIVFLIFFLSNHPLRTKDYVQAGCQIITAIYLLYLGILIKTTQLRYKFRSVAIDKNKSRFIFTTKKFEIYCVDFNDVESIYIVRNKLLPGLNIKTYNGDSYSVPITSINGFCSDLPAEINKLVREDS